MIFGGTERAIKPENERFQLRTLGTGWSMKKICFGTAGKAWKGGGLKGRIYIYCHYTWVPPPPPPPGPNTFNCILIWNRLSYFNGEHQSKWIFCDHKIVSFCNVRWLLFGYDHLKNSVQTILHLEMGCGFLRKRITKFWQANPG